MHHDKRNDQRNNLNDPDQRPADMADHWQRTQEFRKEQMQTGGHHDDQGHTPKLPNKPAVP